MTSCSRTPGLRIDRAVNRPLCAATFALLAGVPALIAAWVGFNTLCARKLPLLDAIEIGDLSTVAYIAHWAPARLESERTEYGFGALHLAAASGDDRMAAFLVQAGVDSRMGTSGMKRTALHVSVHRRNVNVSSVLIAASPELLDVPDRDGNTPLAIAVMEDVQSALFLVKSGADPNARICPEGVPVLYSAAIWGKTDLVNTLLSHGAFVDVQTHDRGWTPLHGAICWGREAIVGILLEWGADPDCADGSGVTPRDLAIESGSTAVIPSVARQ